MDSMDTSFSKLQEIMKERLTCCSPWGQKELDMAERVSNNSKFFRSRMFPGCRLVSVIQH